MKSPIKRPVTLRQGFLYELKDGRRGILDRQYHVLNNEVWLRIPYRKYRWIHLLNWKKEVVKRLRRKTNSE